MPLTRETKTFGTSLDVGDSDTRRSTNGRDMWNLLVL